VKQADPVLCAELVRLLGFDPTLDEAGDPAAGVREWRRPVS